MRQIFGKTRIGGMVLKNRMVRSSTWENMADDQGHMTSSLYQVHKELAAGGGG